MSFSSEKNISSVKNFSVIILAAGLGKRMQNPDIPKVLATINNKPLIYFVLKTAISLNSNQTCVDKICVVVGHKKERVIDYVSKDFFSDFSDDNCKKYPIENIVFPLCFERFF